MKQLTGKSLTDADLCTRVLTFTLSVSGQVKQMLLEDEQDGVKSTHIKIPAAYSSGVTLFARRESELWRELLDAPELPLL